MQRSISTYVALALVLGVSSARADQISFPLPGVDISARGVLPLVWEIPAECSPAGMLLTLSSQSVDLVTSRMELAREDNGRYYVTQKIAGYQNEPGMHDLISTIHAANKTFERFCIGTRPVRVIPLAEKLTAFSLDLKDGKKNYEFKLPDKIPRGFSFKVKESSQVVGLPRVALHKISMFRDGEEPRECTNRVCRDKFFSGWHLNSTGVSSRVDLGHEVVDVAEGWSVAALVGARIGDKLHLEVSLKEPQFDQLFNYPKKTLTFTIGKETKDEKDKKFKDDDNQSKLVFTLLFSFLGAVALFCVASYYVRRQNRLKHQQEVDEATRVMLGDSENSSRY